MKTQIILTKCSSDYESTHIVLAETEDPVLAVRLQSEVKHAVRQVFGESAYPGKRQPGRPGQQVTVVALKDPLVCPSGIRIGEIYDSAMTLSRLLGYQHNIVSQALSTAKRNSLVAVTVNGVTFKYLDKSYE